MPRLTGRVSVVAKLKLRRVRGRIVFYELEKCDETDFVFDGNAACIWLQ